MKTPAGNIGLELPLLIKQGSDFTIDIDLTNEDGTPFDLTLYTHVARLRKKPFATVLYTFTCTSPSVGRLRINMLQDVTALLSCGATLDEDASQYVWDHEFVTISNSVKFPGFYGDVSVFRDI